MHSVTLALKNTHMHTSALTATDTRTRACVHMHLWTRTHVLYLEKLAGEDERENNKKSHVARGMKELRAAPGAAFLDCLDTAKLRLA